MGRPKVRAGLNVAIPINSWSLETFSVLTLGTLRCRVHSSARRTMAAGVLLLLLRHSNDLEKSKGPRGWHDGAPCMRGIGKNPTNLAGKVDCCG